MLSKLIGRFLGILLRVPYIFKKEPPESTRMFYHDKFDKLVQQYTNFIYFIYYFRVGVTPAFRANQFNGAVANVPTTSTSSAASNSTRAHSRNESFGNEVSSERGIETHGKFMRTF